MGFKTTNGDAVHNLFRPIKALRVVQIVEKAKERFVVQEFRTYLFGLISHWATLTVRLEKDEALDYVEKLRDDVNFIKVIQLYIPEQ